MSNNKFICRLFFFRVSIQRCVIKPQPNLADRVVYNCMAPARQVDPWTHRDPPRFNASFGGQEAKHGPRLVAFQGTDKLKELQVGFSTNPRDQHTYRLLFQVTTTTTSKNQVPEHDHLCHGIRFLHGFGPFCIASSFLHLENNKVDNFL